MLRTALSLAVCLTLAGAAPVALAGNPTSTAIAVPPGCAGAVYSWVNVRKAATARIEVRPNGVLLTTAHSGPIGPNGSFTLPSDIKFASGQHYTLGGFLTDAAGRTISQSGAAWWGYC